MKLCESWINKYIINNNLNIKNIINILNNYGFETSYNINIKNKNYIIKKIILYKKISNTISKINIEYKKNIYILYIKNIKENILNKYIILLKKEIKINRFKYIKKIYNIKNFFLPYNNKYSINKKKNFLKKNIFIEINIPFNRMECNNIYTICKQISILINKKINNLKYKIKKKNKYNIYINKNKNIINYKYLIIKKIKIFKKIKNKKIQKKIKIFNLKIKNNIQDIFNYILIESGQKIFYLDLDKIINKYKNKNNKIIKIKNDILLNKKIKKFYINKNTKNIILISFLFKYKYIKKINNKNNKNIIKKYINNYNKNIQDIFLKKTSNIIKNIYKCKITKIKTIKNKNIENKNKIFKLTYKNINKKIGFKIKKKHIINILKKNKYKITKKKKYIIIKIPSLRKDINIKEEIIEEIIKIYGFNKIPKKTFKTTIKIENKKNYINKINNIKNILINIGYKEIINFCFSNKKKEKLISNKNNYINILNPITKDMSILRKSLIPNMIYTIKSNIEKNQCNSIKFFEIGTCFKQKKNKNIQNKKILLIIYGYKEKNKWYIKKNILFNLYDIKGDFEYILKKRKKYKFIKIKKSKNKFLDKQQNINIYYKNKKIGFMGMLNKKIQKKYSFKYPLFLLELKIKKILFKKNIKIKKISKYQKNKRDITLTIKQNINICNIIKTCISINKNLIKKINIIKIYNNKILTKNKEKNITLRLNIQDNKKTLNINILNNIIKKCKKILIKKFNALIY